MSGRQELSKVNLREKLALIDKHWTPKIVGELNGQHVKLAKIKGEFIWHDHRDADELFLVVKGTLTIELRDQRIELTEGEMFIVPRGVEHLPVADGEVHVLLFEPKGTVSTGDVEGDLTAPEGEWI
jgi:mannose-6-phosphate isomerase-like protein (cupin superfamily)